MGRHKVNGWAVWSGVIAGLTYITTSAMLADVVDKKTGALFVLMVGGLQTGTAAMQAALNPRSDAAAAADKR